LEKRIVALQETKGRVPRLIPLHSELISILEDYIQHRLKIPIPLKDLPYLFISRQSGRPWTKMTPNNYVTRFIHHADKLGIDATSHSMRHTFATTLIENDVDISVVQQLLGHKDISTTVRYLKVRTKKKREAVARLPFKLK
jgi:integrase/recombinase XerD